MYIVIHWNTGCGRVPELLLNVAKHGREINYRT